MMDLTDIYIDAHKHDMFVRYYEKMLKIAVRISNRVNRRVWFLARIEECNARLEEGIQACNGWEHEHILEYTNESRMNEAMIAILKEGLFRLHRTYPKHIEQ